MKKVQILIQFNNLKSFKPTLYIVYFKIYVTSLELIPPYVFWPHSWNKKIHIYEGRTTEINQVHQ